MRSLTLVGQRGIGLLIVTLLFAGCDGNTAYPLRSDVANETLNSTLEAWKSGKKPEDLQQATPPVTVQDMDWTGGAKLLAFDVQPDAKSLDANLIAKVKLSLQSPDGKKESKTVTYMVGTDPALTVFRDMFH